MRRCGACSVDVEGTWTRCPLCSEPVTGQTVADPFPAVPLEYSRRRVLKVLFLTSLAIISASFAAQLFFSRADSDIGILRSLWLGVASMWLVVLMAVRKRRNLAKGTVYLVVLVSLVCVYWDYLSNWDGWSLTFAVPIVCASSVVALLITVRVTRMEVGEHVVYSGLTMLLGLLPLLFVALGWVNTPLPSVICGALSFLALVALRIIAGTHVRHELSKRLHV